MSLAEPDTTLEHAHAYATLGLRVIPIHQGQKRPVGDKWQERATTNRDTLNTWWTTNPHYGIGIALGPTEDGQWLFAIDIDGPEGEQAWAELTAQHDPLPPTVEAITGSGGRHLIYSSPHEIRNDQSGRIVPKVDIRGNGGQICAEPTIHPNGHPYTWLLGHAPWHHRIAEAPRWLLELATPKPAPAPTAPVQIGDRPGDLWAAQTSWAEILLNDGWTHHHTDRDGEDYWTRPGKDRREGASATVGHKGSDILKIFTSSLRDLHAEETYTKIGYLAATRHNGDFTAAAAQLRADGHHTTPADWETWIAETTDHTPHQWDTPRLFDEHTDGPPFPIDILPDWIAQHAQAVADTYQVPIDLPAVVAIGALSTLATGHAQINLTGSRWTEHLNIYQVSASPPGAGKSPVFKAMVKPVLDLEAELVQATRSDIRRAEQRKELIEKRVKSAVEAAAKVEADEFLARLDGIERLQAEADAINIPPSPRMIAEDTTPEALVQLLGSHGGRMAIMSSEGGVFDMMGGQYAERGKGPNLAVYLQGWSGDELRRDRKGETVIIGEALLSMCVTTQPAVIGRLGANADLVGRGIAARFMYSIPASLVGHRDRSKVFATIDPAISSTYHQEMTRIGRRLHQWITPITLQLDEPARQLWAAWDANIETRCRPGADLADHAEWVQKLRSTILRLAGLLHLADSLEHHDTISHDTLQRAMTVGDYWIAHMRIVAELWAAAPLDDAGRHIVDWAIQTNRTEFTARDVQLQLRRRFEKISDTVAPLEALIDAGWIHPFDGVPVKVGARGKPSPRFTVHPDAPKLRAMRAMRAQTGDEPLTKDHENSEGVEKCAPCAHVQGRTSPCEVCKKAVLNPTPSIGTTPRPESPAHVHMARTFPTDHTTTEPPTDAPELPADLELF